MKKVIITGAGFGNLGAQAMMFVVVSELKQRFPNIEVVVANSGKLPKFFQNNICFKYKELGLSEYFPLAPIFAKIKLFIYKILNYNTPSLFEFERIVSDSDCVLDISGFALGDQWSDFNCLSFLSRIAVAKKYKKPIVLMPQSFGPFNFKGNNSQYILDKIKSLLSYPCAIYTREKSGFNLLANEYGFKNIMLSSDIVLQSRIENSSDVLIKRNQYTSSSSISSNSCGIVPNDHCYNYAKDKLIDIYEELINYVLDGISDEVYIIRHSSADMTVCELVKKRFIDNDRVKLLFDIHNCYDFSDVVSNFNFIIASRFHSIVHAYKKYIPCITIGWASKYEELLKSLGQEEYFNDIRTLDNSNRIIKQINNIVNYRDKEKAKIKSCLEVIQNNNVFDNLEVILK